MYLQELKEFLITCFGWFCLAWVYFICRKCVLPEKNLILCTEKKDGSEYSNLSPVYFPQILLGCVRSLSFLAGTTYPQEPPCHNRAGCVVLPLLVPLLDSWPRTRLTLAKALPRFLSCKTLTWPICRLHGKASPFEDSTVFSCILGPQILALYLDPVSVDENGKVVLSSCWSMPSGDHS